VPPPGIDDDVHVFMALIAMLAMLLPVAIIYALPYGGRSMSVQRIRILSIVVALLILFLWIAVTPVYTWEYPIDKRAIFKYLWTPTDHELDMGVEDHVSYTGSYTSYIFQ